MADSVEDMMHCPVCSEDYEETADHVPRILPCYDTLCETCIRDLLNGGESLTCPQCKEQHAATKAEKSFPQNKYIVTSLRRKTSEEVEFEKCKQHGREMSLFCKGTSCQKPICSLCLLNDHKNHSMVDVLQEQEELSEKFSARLESSRLFLQSYKTNVDSLKRDLETKFVACKDEINAKREKMNKIYDELVQSADNQMKEIKVHIDEKVANVDDKLVLLDDLKKVTGKKTKYSELAARLDTIEDIKTGLPEHVTYKYVEYEGDVTPLEVLCGSLAEKEISVRVYSINPKVTKDIHTDYYSTFYIDVIAENSVVVCGVLRNKERRQSSVLERKTGPAGIAGVTVRGKQCLAISYDTEKEIIFYSIENLKVIGEGHSTANDQPGILCTASPTTLLYVDYKKNPLEVQWLDCNASRPTATNVTGTNQTWMHDMCVVQDEDKQLLIGTYGRSAHTIQAVSEDSGDIKWSCEGKLPGMKSKMKPFGITTDENGHVFICDKGNSCIQIFSVADGSYVGCLLREGEQGLGEPIWVRWCKNNKALVVCHHKFTPGVQTRCVSIISLD